MPNAVGAGISVFGFDSQTGKLELRQTIGGILNPSYLASDKVSGRIVAVSENFDAEGAIHVFRREPDGKLTETDSQLCGGLASCHVSVSPGGMVCASSYLDGKHAALTLVGGKISARKKLFHYEGRSTNAVRQTSSHPHQAMPSPDGRWLFVCDLGADRIWCHPLSKDDVGPAASDSVSTPAGSGPRHLVFHPLLPRAYVICELNAHLLTYDYAVATGQLTLADEAPTLPSGWHGQPYSAAIRIHPAAATLFVSNRNHDSLTAFQLDGHGGVALIDCFSSGGKAPRDITIDASGRWLLAANQDSNCVAIHMLDSASGQPKFSEPETTPITTPACILTT